MHELKLPFTENIFRSLLGVETKEGLHSVLQSLKNALVLDNLLAPQIKDAILSALEKMAKPFAQSTGSALLGQSILTLLDHDAPVENRFATLQLMKSVGMLPERTSLANLPQVLVSLLSIEGVPNSRSGQVGPRNMFATTMAGQVTATPQAASMSLPIAQQVMTLLKQVGEATPQNQQVLLASLKTLILSNPGMNIQQKNMLTTIIDRAVNAHPPAESMTKISSKNSVSFTKIIAENTIATPYQTRHSSKMDLKKHY